MFFTKEDFSITCSSLQPYYSRPSLPSNAPRVPPSSTPRPVAPTHVYQPGQQMMMIPSQQIPFPNQQGPAYFIPGQYRSTYVATPQQYPVPPGTPGFYPGTSPAEYGTYGKRLCLGLACRYPPLPKTTGLSLTLLSPGHTENRDIIIRDPNQGGRDITEEIMSGGTRSGTTPTPPQVSDDSSEVSYRTLVCSHEPPTQSFSNTPPTQSFSNTPPTQSFSNTPPTQSFSNTPPTPSISNTPPTPSRIKHAISYQTRHLVSNTPSRIKHAISYQKHATHAVSYQSFKNACTAEQATPTSASDAKEPRPANTPAVEEVDETWEEKEDKLDAENIEPKPEDLKYHSDETIYPNSTNLNPEHYTDENSHKCDSSIIPCSSPSELCRPIDPEEKKRYDRDFLLGFQFISAAMSKPEGLPQISDVVLDKANKAPLRQLDPSRLPGMNMGPDFTPSFANLGRPGMGGGGGGHRGGPPSGMGGGGPRRSQQGQRKEPRRIINISSSLTEDVKLNKAEKAWKPAVKKATSGQAAPEEESDDSEQAKTQELFKRVRSILNKLTPQMFQQLMKQVTELTIDTEERLKGVIDLIFEKAISEPNFSVAYANMCRCLIGLKVPTTDKPGVTVNFRKLLLNRCQKEFEKDKDDDVIFEKKQKELDAAAMEEKDRLKAELEEAKDKARRRSLGNIKFIGELFKLKMLTEAIMHDCIVKLLKNHDEESLECLCRLLSTIGKDLDFEKAKPRMDQYFAQMDKIIKEKKTSSRIRFMLQDVLDLRRNTWVPRRGEQGPKTIDQIHKDAELEEHREVLKVQQQLLNQNTRGGDEGWNTVPISTKSRPIDTSRLSKITKVSDTLYCGFSATYRGPILMKREAALTPPPAQNKPALSEEMLEKKSTAIIEEYLHINDMKEALQCVVEMNSTPLLFVFVRSGLESTLERSPIVRERMGLLLHQLYKAGTLPKEQYYRGLQEILEVAEDMAIDVPHIWLYLAELITPMLHEGGIPMGQLFKEISKPLVPQGTAGVLLVQILTLLCKGMSHKKAGAMWREAGLSWKDFLPEDEDVNKFVTEKVRDDETEKSRKKELSSEELNKQLDRLIQDKADNQRIYDWVEANLDETQMSSNMFVRAVMTSICQSAIICENPYKLDAKVITRRAKLLHKYLKDEQKELQALYALQALMVEMEQPANLLRMFFDTLYDEDVIKEEAFNKWESSKDPAEMQGKGVALKSVTAFFTWLREAEDEESDNNS
uniref:Eukaryotic translation initiation factor 4 gamma 1 n=1 Tax=Oncorhynchus tshawytscha TaxID=74940 RepID=A0A8C8IFP3_ONCTS